MLERTKQPPENGIDALISFGNILKLCRKYLNWIQNSVFEGEISEVRLKELTLNAKKIMNIEEDSLIIFSGRTEKWLEKQIAGKEKSSIDNFI